MGTVFSYSYRPKETLKILRDSPFKVLYFSIPPIPHLRLVQDIHIAESSFSLMSMSRSQGMKLLSLTPPRAEPDSSS
jgi:hypothetical protein